MYLCSWMWPDKNTQLHLLISLKIHDYESQLVLESCHCNPFILPFCYTTISYLLFPETPDTSPTSFQLMNLLPISLTKLNHTLPPHLSTSSYIDLFLIPQIPFQSSIKANLSIFAPNLIFSHPLKNYFSSVPSVLDHQFSLSTKLVLLAYKSAVISSLVKKKKIYPDHISFVLALPPDIQTANFLLTSFKYLV